MDIPGSQIKTTCRDIKLLSKRPSDQASRCSSVCHEYYDKWARKKRNDGPESDSDTGWATASPIALSPRYARLRNEFRKPSATPPPPPEKYLRPQSKKKFVIYRTGSCVYPGDIDSPLEKDPRTSRSALGIDRDCNLLPSIKTSRQCRPRKSGTVTSRGANRPNHHQHQTLVRMNTAMLDFTEDIVLRGDKYTFIDKLCKRNKDASKCSWSLEQTQFKDNPGKTSKDTVGRAQLIDFGEIKKILSLRREKIERERTSNLRKSDYTSFSIPVRTAKV